MAVIWFPGLPRWNAAVLDLEARIRFWHRRLCQTDKPHASAIIPCLILWFIWSERNSNIHRHTSFSADTVFNRVKMYLQQIISAGKMGKSQWKGCGGTDMFTTVTWKERPRQQIRHVRWVPPEAGWVKINAAGVWRNLEAGAGGVIRDASGSLLQGFMDNISASSAFDAELQALSIALDIAKEQGRKIWIELGAKDVATLLMSKKYGAAKLRHRVIDIRNKLRHVETKISFIPSQGNKVAEVLAQQGSKERNRTIFGQTLAPAMVNALVRMDQLGFPSFWLRESYHVYY